MLDFIGYIDSVDYMTWKVSKKNKYGNKKVEHKGYSFASKGEAGLFDFLKLREANGDIKDIKVQDTVYLTDARIMYKPDYAFTNCETGEREWAEYKGFETDVWALKKRLWKYYGPGRLTVYYARGEPEVIVSKAENPSSAHSYPKAF